MNEDKMIWRRELQAIIGVSSETIRRWKHNGRLPAPDVAISNKTIGWKRSTLRQAGINV